MLLTVEVNVACAALYDYCDIGILDSSVQNNNISNVNHN